MLLMSALSYVTKTMIILILRDWLQKKVEIAPDVDRGILICGSGFGMEIAANKYKGIRAVLPMSSDHAYQARHDDDANVLAIAADFMEDEIITQMIKVFLVTPFSKNERHVRRIEKISQSEIGK